MDCAKRGCRKPALPNSNYCAEHRPRLKSTKKKHTAFKHLYKKKK